MVRHLRQDLTTPLVFMTYANVVFSYGIDRFCAACAEVGVDGLILPDVPYEEKDEFELECRRHRLDLISMVAPTSEARITAIARGAKGFLYVVSSLGVTGMRSAITTDIGAMIKKIRENTSLPCAVGFGISTPEQAWHMAALSDGAIVAAPSSGSWSSMGQRPPPMWLEYVRTMKQAVNAH